MGEGKSFPISSKSDLAVEESKKAGSSIKTEKGKPSERVGRKATDLRLRVSR